MAAQVKRADVTNNQVVELITSGRSGDIGFAKGAEPEEEIADSVDATSGGPTDKGASA
jgi:hypothetical protein